MTTPDNPKVIEALEWCVKCYDQILGINGPMPSSWPSFDQKKLAMIIDGSWALNTYSSISGLDYGVAQVILLLSLNLCNIPAVKAVKARFKDRMSDVDMARWDFAFSLLDRAHDCGNMSLAGQLYWNEFDLATLIKP